MTDIDAKKFYNEIMPTKQGTDYEYARWHKTAILEVGYQQTKQTVEGILNKESDASIVLELGPGVGTWSRFLRKRYHDAMFTLVDISREMLNRAKGELGTDNISYIESSFADFQTEKQYDFFFSSRVVEYIENKDDFVQKVFDVLSRGAHGVIITKMPHYARMKMMGKFPSTFHSGQITPSEFSQKLKNVGLKIVSIRPVVISVPLFKSAQLNNFVGKIVQAFPTNIFTNAFVESYVIVFEK